MPPSAHRACRLIGLQLVCVLICSVLQAVSGHNAAGIERTAQLLHGAVKTTRSIASLRGQSRMLFENAANAQEHVWIIGLPAELQHSVQGTLHGHQGEVLHALPGDDHHWLVNACTRTVMNLLAAHPEVTAALLPDDYKISPAISEAADQLTGSGSDTSITLMAIMPDASPKQLLKAAHAAQQQLATLLQQGQQSVGCTVQASAGPHVVSVQVCSQVAEAAAAWLATQPRVTWVDMQKPTKANNLHAGATIQSGSKMDVLPPPEDQIRQGIAGGLFPFWAAGLDGSGQVVGVVDSGFDTDSCFLFDPAVPDPTVAMNSNDTLLALGSLVNPATIPTGYDQDFQRYAASVGSVRTFADPSHRKVVQLVQFADAVPALHGTHTCVTVAGNAFGFNYTQNPTLATGIAPGAKLALFDIGKGDTESLNPPVYPSLMFDTQKQAGAYISSNSWGGSGVSAYAYDASSFLVDAFAVGEPDFLLVFAAGNDGSKLDQPITGTVSSPATAKNVLAVGATENFVQEGLYGQKPQSINLTSNGQQVPVNTTGWNGLGAFYTNRTYVRVLGLNNSVTTLVDGFRAFGGFQPPIDSIEYFTLVASNQDVELSPDNPSPPNAPLWAESFLQFLLQLAPQFQVVLADNTNACQPLTSNYATTPTIVLVRKSTTEACPAYVSVGNVYNSQAAGVLLYWADAPGPVIAGAGDFYNQVRTIFPAATIMSDLGQQIEAALAAGTPVSLRIDPYNTTNIPIENIAEFSSFGSLANYTTTPPGNYSTLDVRIKPDVVAPGFLLSGDTDGIISGNMDSCEAIYLQGTSMATPATSGTAAIVRQYFTAGYYPTGAATAANQHTPSAPLIKAVMIAGTAAMNGITRINGLPIQPPPSPWQGFGRIDLSSSLPLAGNPNGLAMQVVDQKNMTALGQADNYTLTVAAGQLPFVVTLVWNDYPAYPGVNAPYVLVNNLDLTVQGPDGTVYWGNNRPLGDIQNNVEKVYIAQPAAGTYSITVTAKYLFSGAGGQSYSLVALGSFTGQLSSPANPASTTPQ